MVIKKSKEKFVIDTSVILSGVPISLEYEIYTTPGVTSEIKSGGRMRQRVKYLLNAGLTVRSPSKDEINAVKREAKKTGDYARMSETDFEILALAKELNAILLTDDYSIQNLATVVGVKYRPIAQRGIVEKIIWNYRCKGCGMYWGKMYNRCPICGSKVRTIYVKR